MEGRGNETSGDAQETMQSGLNGLLDSRDSGGGKHNAGSTKHHELPSHCANTKALTFFWKGISHMLFPFCEIISKPPSSI